MQAGDADTTHATLLRIEHDHPSLEGHFPGQPVVPGVLLLDRVVAAAEAWLGTAVIVRSLPQVKFVAPLLPGQDAQLELKRAGAELRFSVRRADAIVAQGVLTCAFAGAPADSEGAGN